MSHVQANMKTFSLNKISGEREALPRIMWADCDPEYSHKTQVAVYSTKADQRGNRPDLKPVRVMVISLDQSQDKILTDVENSLRAAGIH